MKTIQDLKSWAETGKQIYSDNPLLYAEYQGMVEGIKRCEEILKPIDVNKEKPTQLMSVLILVNKTRPFWTKGYLHGENWYYMDWEKEICDLKDVTHWLPLPDASFV